MVCAFNLASLVYPSRSIYNYTYIVIYASMHTNTYTYIHHFECEIVEMFSQFARLGYAYIQGVPM